MKKSLTLVLALVLVMSLMIIDGIQTSSAASAGFIYRSGRNFMLNGNKFYFMGDNLYYLGMTDSGSVDSKTAAAAGKGVKVMRFWAYSNGTSNSIQPSLGSWNETALRQLDYAVKKCKDNGIYVLLTVSNYWNDYNGGQWYVDQVLGSGQAFSNFYTNSSVKQALKNYINMLVNRTNYYTGVQYKNESAIFAWELMNEPRCPSDTSGTTLYNWVNEMSTYFKNVDSNHLVGVGEEGWKTSDNSNGCDFTRNTGATNIDMGSIHLYPDTWGESLSWCDSFIDDRASSAHNTDGKPLVVGEFGRLSGDGDRDTVYTEWTNRFSSDDIDGAAPWQMETNTAGDWDFAFTSSTATIMQNFANSQAGKCGSGGATPTPGPTPTPSSNLALNKPATASSVEKAGEEANLAFDGNTSTRWGSAYSDPQWIYVDLGATYSIGRVKLTWEAAYAISYKIQVSSDASNWTDAYSTTSGDGGVDDITFTAKSGRYVRMYGTQRYNSNWGYSLYEFEVYQASGATPTPTPTPSGSRNLCLNRTTCDASGYITGEDPYKAFDGSVSNDSKWCYDSSGAKYLRIDLGQTYSITRWVVGHAGAGGETIDYNTKDFQFQQSSDNTNWTVVDSVNGNTANVTDRNVTAFTSRYLKLYITTPTQNGNTAARIYEFEVWGN